MKKIIVSIIVVLIVVVSAPYLWSKENLINVQSDPRPQSQYLTEIRLSPEGEEVIQIDTGKLVSYDELIRNPEKYKGKIVAMICYLVKGFEASALAGSAIQIKGAIGAIPLFEGAIWYSGGDPDRSLMKEYTSGGMTTRYARVYVEGTFLGRGRFGHMGIYKTALKGTKIIVLKFKFTEVNSK